MTFLTDDFLNMFYRFSKAYILILIELTRKFSFFNLIQK